MTLNYLGDFEREFFLAHQLEQAAACDARQAEREARAAASPARVRVAAISDDHIVDAVAADDDVDAVTVAGDFFFRPGAGVVREISIRLENLVECGRLSTDYQPGFVTTYRAVLIQ